MRKTSRASVALLLGLTLAAFGAGCSGQKDDPKSTPAVTSDAAEKAPSPPVETADINIAVLKGPTGIGAAQLMDKAAKGETQNRYSFTLAGAPDEVTAKVISGELDMAAVPSNAAAILYNKTNQGVAVVAAPTLGNLQILANGLTVTSVADLKGQTIDASGQGATPEYALRFLLTKAGLDPDKDVTIQWHAEHSELAALMVSGDVKLGLLPEPFVTQVMGQNQDVKPAVDLTKAWDEATGGSSQLVMSALVVNRSFLDQHPGAVKIFLAEYKESIEFGGTNLDEVAQMSEQLDIMKAGVVKAAYQRCNIVYLAGQDMKTALGGFLQVMFEVNPAFVGGSLPGDDFYYVD